MKGTEQSLLSVRPHSLHNTKSLHIDKKKILHSSFHKELHILKNKYLQMKHHIASLLSYIHFSFQKRDHERMKGEERTNYL